MDVRGDFRSADGEDIVTGGCVSGRKKRIVVWVRLPIRLCRKPQLVLRRMDSEGPQAVIFFFFCWEFLRKAAEALDLDSS